MINPATGKVLTKISEGTPKDVDLAVAAAQKASDTTWGSNISGAQRGKLLNKLADLMEARSEELAAVEALDNGPFVPTSRISLNHTITLFIGKTVTWAKGVDVPFSIATIRYYAGWCDKNHGKTMDTDSKKLVYTLHEPFGVVGQIIPW